MEITDFLLARIAEDEEAARAASPGPWHTNVEADEVLAVDGITVAEGFALSGPQLRATTAHIALHDPARVLGECRAKRAIIELAEEASGLDASVDLDRAVGPRDMDADPYVGDSILRRLAAVYADHPEYRQEWKP